MKRVFIIEKDEEAKSATVNKNGSGRSHRQKRSSVPTTVQAQQHADDDALSTSPARRPNPAE